MCNQIQSDGNGVLCKWNRIFLCIRCTTQKDANRLVLQKNVQLHTLVMMAVCCCCFCGFSIELFFQKKYAVNQKPQLQQTFPPHWIDVSTFLSFNNDPIKLSTDAHYKKRTLFSARLSCWRKQRRAKNVKDKNNHDDDDSNDTINVAKFYEFWSHILVYFAAIR